MNFFFSAKRDASMHRIYFDSNEGTETRKYGLWGLINRGRTSKRYQAAHTRV